MAAEPVDAVFEVLKEGDRVAFEPPSKCVVGRVVRVERPSGLIGGQPRPGIVSIELQIDLLYYEQQGQANPLGSVFKLAEPEKKSLLN